MSKPVVHVYTDGACLGNPGPGGWAALLRFGRHEKELVGAASYTTNNRMELRAALNALQALKRPCTVYLHTDSEYLRNGITRWVQTWERNGWRTAARKPVKNQDLWRALLEAAEKHEVHWDWIKGHAGHPENTRVDRLASEAAASRAAQEPPDMEDENTPLL
ncbi:MAG: ribonuclease HI [Caldilineae bacterium]|nr:MAG: ribonuclease HI [Caldilineae bacterium]